MKSLRAGEIIRLAETPTNTGSENYLVKRQLLREGSVKELIVALQTSTSHNTRQYLCYILGMRHAKTAVPVLLECLNDPSAEVRNSAAEALAKVRKSEGGDVLLKHFIELEKDIEVRRTLAMTLGAIGYQPAIPVLVQALKSPDVSLRGMAAWSLGELKAIEGFNALQQALALETEWYAQTRMKAALEIIREAAKDGTLRERATGTGRGAGEYHYQSAR